MSSVIRIEDIRQFLIDMSTKKAAVLITLLQGSLRFINTLIVEGLWEETLLV